MQSHSDKQHILFIPSTSQLRCKYLSLAPGLREGWLLWQTGGHFAMLQICPFRQGMGRTPQAEHIQEVRFEDFMFANDLQVHT